MIWEDFSPKAVGHSWKRIVTKDKEVGAMSPMWEKTNTIRMKKTAAKKVTDREDQEGKHLCSFSFLGSDSEYSGEEEDEEDLEDEDSASGTSLYGEGTWTERERDPSVAFRSIGEFGFR